MKIGRVNGKTCIPIEIYKMWIAWGIMEDDNRRIWYAHFKFPIPYITRVSDPYRFGSYVTACVPVVQLFIGYAHIDTNWKKAGQWWFEKRFLSWEIEGADKIERTDS